MSSRMTAADDARLADLLADERALSRRRTALHERISFLGTGDPQLDLLRDQERQLSVERRALQQQIDDLRANG